MQISTEIRKTKVNEILLLGYLWLSIASWIILLHTQASSNYDSQLLIILGRKQTTLNKVHSKLIVKGIAVEID